ncbi:aldehyde dehydrogenase family protein [Kocuria coralli]|uniref:Aldehyde dehydrogenase family protein n=1 Tax=Kocuria coralli TaxID=1461025 RepID=A0A5J5KZX7_9MICC|nr:benzaldehyde dehydrogenase [Kocuria coralli]KAA9394271.1 aldehyde dehydrogenase family protein [Kocuria coralli]
MGLLDTALFENAVFTGRWTSGGGDPLTVRNPANDDVLATVGTATPDEVREAATRAAKAQEEWARTKPSERAAIMRRAGQIIEDYAEEIAGWVVRETGGIPPKADLEVHVGAAECYEASALPTHPQGQWLPSDSAHWSLARRRPAGVVTVISPFNFPLILSIRSAAPALALGNSVLLKPDPRTTVTGGFLIARAFEEAGLPEGVLQVLPGGGDVGAAAVAADEVRIVSFTGSTAAGRIVGAEGGRLLKRTHLELGGNNAVVVLPGADLDLASSAGAMGSFFHQGQICMTTGRHVVHEEVYDEYLAKLSERADNLVVGDPSAGPVHLGPIIDERQLKNIDSIVQETVIAGASVRSGATHDGLFYRPTVLADLTPEMPAWKDEIFGPVAPVLSVGSADEAVQMVNASDYGLSVSVIGPVSEAMKVADGVRSGKVHINEMTVGDQAHAPFGGVGDSGTGSRFGGADANIEAFTETQWVTVSPEIVRYPF